MPIRCHAEFDGRGIVLSQIETLARAERIQNFFTDLGIPARILEPKGSANHRLHLERVSLEIFRKISYGAPVDSL